MNKRTMRIAGWALGLSMAVAGIGAAVGASFLGANEPIMAKADSVNVTFTVDVEKSDNLSLSKNGVSVTATGGVFNRTDNYRVYANQTMTISAENQGYSISAISFTYSQNKFSANTGSFSDDTNTSWSGSASSVTFSAGAQVRFTTFTVTITDAVRTVSSVTGVANHPTTVYQNGSIDVDSVDLSVQYSDSTSGTEKPDHIVVDTTSIANGVVATAWFTEEETDNSMKATFTVDVIAVPLKGTFTFTSSNVAGGALYDASAVNQIGTIAVAKGNGTTNPAWNAGDSALRLYSKNTITITLTEYAIESVEFNCGTVLADPYVSCGTWDGANKKITFEDDDMFKTVTFQNSTTATSGNTKFTKIVVNYKQYEERVPAKLTASWSGVTGNVYNGTTNASKIQTTAISVNTFTSDDKSVASYGDGTGFIVNVAGITVDATSEAKTISFSGVEPGVYDVKITVPGVGADGADVINLAALSVTVTAKDITSYGWQTEPTSVYYSGRDTFAFDGSLAVTFNDDSTGVSGLTRVNVLHEYSESAENHAGDVIDSIPTFNDGTVKTVNPTSKYVIESYYSQYPTATHAFKTIEVNMPSLLLEDNYDGAYYVGVERTLDMKVTAVFGGDSQVLSSSDYVLSVSSVNPTNTDPIPVTATWKKGGETVAVSSAYNIEPTESSRTLTDLLVNDKEFSAGSYFVLNADDILLSGIENAQDFDEYLNQNAVVFETEGGETIDSNTRLLPRHAGTVTATYWEGLEKSATTTFELSVGAATVASYTPGSVAEHATAVSSIALNDVVYLVSEGGKVQLSGISSTSTKYGTGASYTTYIDDSVYALTVVAGASEGTYSFKTTANTYLYWGSGNSLNTTSTHDASSSWTLSFNGTTVTIKNADTSARQICWNNDRFACYGSNYSNYKTTQLYKIASTPAVGNAVDYLKSVIDAYRINNGSEAFSICSSSGLYASSEWAKAKAAYLGLTVEQKAELAITDYFNPRAQACTYVDTYDMLIANEPIQNNSSGLLFKDSQKDNTGLIVTLVAAAGILATGGYFFLRKKKEN